MVAGSTLTAAREALEAREWAEALELFASADAETGLTGDDLVAMADAAFWSGHVGVALGALQRAHATFLTDGKLAEAGDVALVTCRLHAMQGDTAVGAGWLERARRDLADVPECAAHAHLMYLETYVFLLFKEYEQAAAGAREVETIATRVGDRDHVVLARAMQGFIATHTGDISGGMRLLDEAVATATAGELGLFASAEVFCEMVVSSLAVADYERASEWLDQAERSDRIVCFPGCCRVHRTTVHRHRGDWAQARRSAAQARAEVAGVESLHEGMALAELGELHRYHGDLGLAERAFGEAHEKGWSAQPGLALVLLANDDLAGAARMIARAVESSAQELSLLVTLLPAQAEIAIADGDADTAEAAGRRLVEVAATLGTSAAAAAAAGVSGLVLHHRGDLSGAVRELEQAVRTWQTARNPYEVARARLLLATVLEELGDESSAKLELVAARRAFDQLGATPAVAEVARRLGEAEPVHARRAFMFTDIVNSTELLTAVGDDAWHGIHRWHDRVASDIFAAHQGSVVKDTGDGFFVVFDDAQMAVDSAIALQRALEAHRRADGFAPAVRIGLHVGSAVTVNDDYLGRDVVVAARVGAVAGAGEILISGDVAALLRDRIRLGERQSRSLKGIREPVELATVDWQ